jgi:ubiquinone/menaquinone biosynthesis C-methylase UbiE
MSQTEQTPSNADQVAYWNDKAGETWASFQSLLDHQIAPLGARAMDALSPSPGETIIDVGCGCGDTTLALARAVGPSGAVTGVDISRPMLEVAADRITQDALPQAAVVEADAQTFAFEPGAADAIFSRFGVMFFHQPAVAFANLRSGLKPGGRLAFVCWRPLAQNPWMGVPLAAALTVVPPPPPPADPFAPGPFAFSDPDRVRGILAEAGFVDIEIEPHDQKIGGHPLPQALLLAQKVGPGALLMRENPERREAITAALSEALAAHETADGVMLDSATWIVTARNG